MTRYHFNIKTDIVLPVTMTIVTIASLVAWSCSCPADAQGKTAKVELSERQKRALLREKYSAKKVSDVEDYDYIVIGSGMSGMTSATILARLGHRVLVLEQHPDVAGGGTHSFDLGGFRFDSGLHYTVPWSVPLLALTCCKDLKECTSFKLMGEPDGTVDKIFLVDADGNTDKRLHPFRMKYKEGHLKDLYAIFPEEKKAIDNFIDISNRSMTFVKIFLAIRLLPKWMQEFCWSYLVPHRFIDPVSMTAKELLPKMTRNKLLCSLLTSMWIDTGARPDRATFMLTASVFRGISLEGGVYPSGGSESMCMELATALHANSGQLLIRATVDSILIENGRATGVSMQDEFHTQIKAKKGVISSVGYKNTFSKLVSENVCSKLGIPRKLSIPQSAGFIMCNIGIKANPEEIGVTNTNIWHIPVDKDGDSFSVLEQYFDDPLGNSDVIPAFITFPSMKDQEWSAKHPNCVSCQMLLMAEYEWFGKLRGPSADTREANYIAVKDVWRQRCIDIFLKYFPLAEGKITVSDVSTPLTIENYLNAQDGGAVGIDVVPERFTSPIIRQQLDVVTSIEGLYMTGQDMAIIGVTLAQLSGLITAFRISGFFSSCKIILQSILKKN